MTIHPVRAPHHTPITLARDGQLHPPLAADHPLADHPCAVCDLPLSGMRVSLVVVGFASDPTNLHPDPTAYSTASAVPVHAECTWAPSPRDETAQLLARTAFWIARDYDISTQPDRERMIADLNRAMDDILSPEDRPRLAP